MASVGGFEWLILVIGGGILAVAFVVWLIVSSSKKAPQQIKTSSPNKEFRTKISGVTHNCPITGVPRQDIIRDHVRPGTKLNPQLEPENEYSENAVALYLQFDSKKFHLGYLNEKVAGDIADCLRDGIPVKVVVSEVTGGTDTKQIRGVNLLIKIS